MAYLLAAITNDSGNYFALKASGDYTVDWGDGTTDNVSAGVKAEHQYAWADIDSDTTVTYNGATYRQAIVTVTPQALNDLTDVNLQQRHSFYSAFTVNTPWLDVLANSTELATFTLGSTAALTNFTMLEQLVIQENALTALDYTVFCTASAQIPVLHNIEFGDMPALVTNNSFLSNFLGTTNVTIGNIPLLIDASYLVWSYAGNVINLSIGNLPLATNVRYLLDTNGDAGNVTVGDMNSVVTLSGPLLYCAGASFGNVTIGSMTSLTTITERFLYAALGSFGDVTVGATPALATVSNAIISALQGSIKSFSMADTSGLVTVDAGSAGMFAETPLLRSLSFNSLALLATATQMFQGCAALESLDLDGVHLANIDVSNCAMSAVALAALFTSLGTATAKTITVTGNYGAPSLTAPQLLIATAKGWTVVQ